MNTSHHATSRRRPAATLVAGLSILLGVAGIQAPPVLAEPPLVDFDVEPYHVPSMGLSLSLPLSADVRTSWAGPVATIRVTDAKTRWVVDIQQGSLPEDASVTTLADRLEERHLRRGSPARLLSRRDDLEVGGHGGEQLYFQLRAEEGEAPVVQAHTFVGVGEGRVITFSLTTSKPVLDVARVAYEGMLASARVRDPSREIAERKSGLDATQAILEAGLSPHLDALVGIDRWYRLAEPATTGLDADATEYGYRRLRLSRGKAGEVDPSRPPSGWSARDRATGYVLEVRSRLLIDNRVIDSTGRYFLADDRSAEGWRVEMTVADGRGRESGTWTEVGRREGETLTITTRTARGEDRATEVTIPPRGYLSQVEALLWPELLARAGTPGDYASYAYRPQEASITLRRGEFGPAPDRPGVVRLKALDDAGRATSEHLFREDGMFISSTLENGRVWEPTTRDELAGLWRRKDLELE